jgi:hypothetical protein
MAFLLRKKKEIKRSEDVANKQSGCCATPRQQRHFELQKMKQTEEAGASSDKVTTTTPIFRAIGDGIQDALAR